MEEKGLKPRTIHLKLSAVKSFYLYCMEENKLQKNSTLTVIQPKIDDQRGGKLSRVTVEKQFQQFSETLGFKITPHTMRQTFAAHLAEKNMPQSYIEELLGHVNINSTRLYTRLMENARKTYDRYQV